MYVLRIKSNYIQWGLVRGTCSIEAQREKALQRKKFNAAVDNSPC